MFTDPGADAWSATVNFGDNTGEQCMDIDQEGKSFNLGHTYAESGTYAVTVIVQDDDGGTHADTFRVEVILTHWTPETTTSAAAKTARCRSTC